MSETAGDIDFDKFRLRRFVDALINLGEVDIHETPIAFADISKVMEDSPRASLFKNAGPERCEIVGAVSGSRARLGAAFGVDPRDVSAEYTRRMDNPQPVVDVASANAPVHAKIITGDDIDLTKLPFHLQHEYDGGAYITSGIDYTVDPATGKPNTGCRRLMLRSRTTMQANLTQPSDLRGIYVACVERGEKLPVSYVCGSHPLDFIAAGLRLPTDEFGLVASLRGEPVPMVRGVSNDVPVPADAEMVIEGYFDELGYREIEGPYGEFNGFYGAPHIDPVFHVTAITQREDALHQTMLHSGRHLSRTDSANLGSINSEVAVRKALNGIHLEASAVRCLPTTNGRQHVRISIPRTGPGQARRVISALFAIPYIKHIFVMDDDVDVFSDEDVEWAMATRFHAERDMVVEGGFPAFYMEPLPDPGGTVTKAGFDLTEAYGRPDTIDNWIAVAPELKPAPRFQTVRQALESGPLFFSQIMEALGSDDGREISMDLHALREEGILDRLGNGEWILKDTSG
ncbi:MAG: UbiD family decarboxylase [Rhodospirillaceae bacterium]|jgi:2,5-furandicarboxylate decarboxylase 1|nr:UbiD family decarboxylase [Rhodospirillaceae bacterium]MBT5457171.1 UbiD family decarboxylase [Rhodospirillaceae bacterium]